MSDHWPQFVGCVIVVAGMAFTWVMGYLMGYNDAKRREGL
jgi:hypothetical protein